MVGGIVHWRTPKPYLGVRRSLTLAYAEALHWHSTLAAYAEALHYWHYFFRLPHKLEMIVKSYQLPREKQKSIRKRRIECNPQPNRVRLNKQRYDMKRQSDPLTRLVRNDDMKKRMERLRSKRNPETISGLLNLRLPLKIVKIPPEFQKYPQHHTCGIAPSNPHDRCKNSQGIKVWNGNIDEIMRHVARNQFLRKEIKFGQDTIVCSPSVVLDKNRRPWIAVIHANQLKDQSIFDKKTLYGSWVSRDVNKCGPHNLLELLRLRSEALDGIQDVIGERSKSKAAEQSWQHRGQHICQNGTMITAKHVNAASYKKDADGLPIGQDQYYLSRGEMGREGQRTDKLCRECITPGCAFANHIFHAWPDKMQPLPECVQHAFDGSKRLSYTNMLITVGNGKEDETVTHVLDTEGKVLRTYLHKKAGTMVHTDKDNTGPCVALFFGAYEGFDYHFPTLDIRVKAPSGTALVGDMKLLIHAVGGGTGVRFSLVYAQHKQAVDGVLVTKNSCRVLAGAKRSKKDVDRENTMALAGNECNTAVILGLSMYDFT